VPGGDGIALLEKLRSGGHPKLPAIAVSAYADSATRGRVLAAGFNGFVSKPLDPFALADEIVRTLESRS
jgi:CheY-like chemotaxis protein